MQKKIICYNYMLFVIYAALVTPHQKYCILSLYLNKRVSILEVQRWFTTWNEWTVLTGKVGQRGLVLLDVR